MNKAFVAYYRVSTRKQGSSGLGLGAQRMAVQSYIGDAELLGEYTEIESGKNSNRPELEKAIAVAKQLGATLLVAKMDRLARNMAFVANLMDSDLDFVCCDMPHATRLTLHIFAAVAEDEGRRISDRIKAALAEKRRKEPHYLHGLAQIRNFRNVERRKRIREIQSSGGKRSRIWTYKVDRQRPVTIELLEDFWRLRNVGMSLRNIKPEMERLGYGKISVRWLNRLDASRPSVEQKQSQVMELVNSFGK
jgi:DNA invertase Pin-like site-specific DNA recombinase